MAVSIAGAVWNTGSYSDTFIGGDHAIIIIERDGGDWRSISSAIRLGSLPMTLLQYSHNDWLIAFWGAVVPPSLVGTSYNVIRTKGTHDLTNSFDVIKLCGVSSNMLYAARNVYVNVASATYYSHQIASKHGGMVIDTIMSGEASPGTGQLKVFSDPRSRASYKANTVTGKTGMSWNWEASRANYVCVSIKPKVYGSGARGVL